MHGCAVSCRYGCRYESHEEGCLTDSQRAAPMRAAERWLEPGTEYAVRRTMPAEWYRGWAPEVAQAMPPADADVAQYSIQARHAPR